VQAKVARSVVTITCGSTTGTGFSVFATFSDAEIAAGWKSYMVTTDATIAGCINPVRDVAVTVPGLTSVATHRVWSTPAGLAGVLSEATIPPMDIGGTQDPGSKVTVAVRAMNPAGWGASTTVTARSR
jgi:hypothetical protein